MSGSKRAKKQNTYIAVGMDNTHGVVASLTTTPATVDPENQKKLRAAKKTKHLFTRNTRIDIPTAFKTRHVGISIDKRRLWQRQKRNGLTNMASRT